MGVLLSLQSVSAFYGHLQALQAVSLHVNEGEIVALLGANGAGKTTTLNTICSIVEARSGTITFDGKEITHASPEQIVDMGLIQVPEGRQIFNDLSVRENLTIGGYRMYRSGKKAQIAGDIERMVEFFPILGERLDHRAGTLSGGQQQMLAISRALMAHPRMLLLDEPSLGLAPNLVTEIMTTIKDLRDMGTTILLVEQNALASLKIAERGYVMETGRTVLEGTSTELLRDREVRRAYLGKDFDEF
ncbi:MAG: ABC transporter ATP-binding protein [Armatimonadota bacterium]